MYVRKVLFNVVLSLQDMWNIFFTILLCYLMVRFIFGFVVPVVSTYLKMKNKMKEMNGFNSTSNDQHKNKDKFSSPSNKASKSDYIDFEEIK
jgi:hypothetical protein